MTASIHQKALYALATVLFGITANGSAQEAAPALTCSGGASCPEPPIAIAQMTGPAVGQAQVRVLSSGGIAFGMQESAEVVKNQPYLAQAVTEMKQTLADGSHIAQTTTATVARDSDGRTVRIQKLTTMGPWRSSGSSQGNSENLTTIFDPVSKEHIDFTSDNKVAHVVTMPPLPTGAPAGAEGAFSMAYGG